MPFSLEDAPASVLQDKLAEKLVGTKVDGVFVEQYGGLELIHVAFDNGHSLLFQEVYLASPNE